MNLPNVGLIGAGRVARIFLGGWQRAGLRPEAVVATDTNAAALGTLQQLHPYITPADAARAAQQPVLILAVPATATAAVAGEIRPHLGASTIVVSPIPMLTLADLQKMLGDHTRVARVIPNAPSIVGAGMNPLAFAAGLSEADRQRVVELLAPLGACPVVPEDKLNGYMVLAARGPAYFWFQLYELLGYGLSLGLTRAESLAALQAALDGAAATMRDSGLSPAEVRDLIPTHPLGPAEAAVLGAYRASVAKLIK